MFNPPIFGITKGDKENTDPNGGSLLKRCSKITMGVMRQFSVK
jgi:hypothetical protein